MRRACASAAAALISLLTPPPAPPQPMSMEHLAVVPPTRWQRVKRPVLVIGGVLVLAALAALLAGHLGHGPLTGSLTSEALTVEGAPAAPAGVKGEKEKEEEEEDYEYEYDDAPPPPAGDSAAEAAAKEARAAAEATAAKEAAAREEAAAKEAAAKEAAAKEAAAKAAAAAAKPAAPKGDEEKPDYDVSVPFLLVNLAPLSQIALPARSLLPLRSLALSAAVRLRRAHPFPSFRAAPLLDSLLLPQPPARRPAHPRPAAAARSTRARRAPRARTRAPRQRPRRRPSPRPRRRPRRTTTTCVCDLYCRFFPALLRLPPPRLAARPLTPLFPFHHSTRKRTMRRRSPPPRRRRPPRPRPRTTT